MEAIAAPPTTTRAVVRYDDIARALALGFKYGARLDLAAMMGRWKARAGTDALLPVPLHRRRLWAAPAAAISKICGVPGVHAALKRVRATAPQPGQTPARADNVQDAIRVPAE